MNRIALACWLLLCAAQVHAQQIVVTNATQIVEGTTAEVRLLDTNKPHIWNIYKHDPFGIVPFAKQADGAIRFEGSGRHTIQVIIDLDPGLDQRFATIVLGGAGPDPGPGPDPPDPSPDIPNEQGIGLAIWQVTPRNDPQVAKLASDIRLLANQLPDRISASDVAAELKRLWLPIWQKPEWQPWRKVYLESIGRTRRSNPQWKLWFLEIAEAMEK